MKERKVLIIVLIILVAVILTTAFLYAKSRGKKEDVASTVAETESSTEATTDVAPSQNEISQNVAVLPEPDPLVSVNDVQQEYAAPVNDYMHSIGYKRDFTYSDPSEQDGYIYVSVDNATVTLVINNGEADLGEDPVMPIYYGDASQEDIDALWEVASYMAFNGEVDYDFKPYTFISNSADAVTLGIDGTDTQVVIKWSDVNAYYNQG